MKSIRLDNAPELLSTVRDWGQASGVRYNPTVPYTSSQNGVAERSIQTSENNMRAMTKDAGCGYAFWDEAVKAQAYVRNMMATGPPIDGKDASPIQHWTKKRPSIDHLRVWGSRCYGYVDPKSLPGRQDKLMDRARLGMLMGYTHTTKQYRMWAPDMRKIIRVISIRFDESNLLTFDEIKILPTFDNIVSDRNAKNRPKLVSHSTIGGQALPENVPVLGMREKDNMQADRRPPTSLPTELEGETRKMRHMAIPKRRPTGESFAVGEHSTLGAPNAGSQSETTISPAVAAVPSDQLNQTATPTDQALSSEDTPITTITDASGREQYEVQPYQDKRRRDSDTSDLQNIKHHRVLLAAAAEEEALVEDVKPTPHRISISRTFEAATSDPVFRQE